MAKDIRFGDMNGHAIGIVMKELVRRAIMAIHARRFIFEATGKMSKLHPAKDDLVTDADHEAQSIYIKVLREVFPSFGIVAEEDGVNVKSTHPSHNLWFTVDPLDGTKAFVHMQSHGIGTMISLVCDDEIVAAYVGDANTQEIYGYRPGSDQVHRVASDFTRRLEIDPNRPLSDQRALLRDDARKHSTFVRERLLPIGTGPGAVKDLEVEGGSIGISMARLWKGEVGMAILRPGWNTPWDLCPVYGISSKLGFLFFSMQKDGMWGSYEYLPWPTPTRMDGELIVIHKSRVSELPAAR